jgi:thioredoxin reductase (NADPH)
MDEVRDVIIIGSGPAGLTAAVYAGRANLAPLLFEGEPSSTSDQPGGQLMLTTDVENYPGFPDGVQGPELMQMFRNQAMRFGAGLRTAKVTAVDFSERPFRVWVGDELHRARTVIVSTGAQSLMLGLDRETELIGHGVSTCATCDGYFFRTQEIAVVGGGDTAMEEAIYLTRFATKVILVHRRDSLRASKIMQDKARSNPKIEWRLNHEVDEIKDTGRGEVTSVVLRDVTTGVKTDVPVSGVFVAIGHTPNTGLFKGQLELNANGYLITHDGAKTSLPGVFACGDVQDHVYRQAITAAGSGCMAAIDAERYLEGVPGHLQTA